jgi:hypothetical protein
MKINELKNNLESAMRHVELLCKGFSVEVTPSYRSVLDKVCTHIETKHSWRQDMEQLLFVINGNNVKSALAFSSSELLKQFKTKFIKIAKDEIVPELKKFCAKNSDIHVEDFRPLFDIKIVQR